MAKISEVAHYSAHPKENKQQEQAKYRQYF
jgi:hypothetical protein